MENPAGYLYRVAQTDGRRDRARGRRVSFPPEITSGRQSEPVLDDQLVNALRELNEPHRIAVLLVHAYGWTPQEIAEMTGSKPATVRSHLRRGLRQMRTLLTESSEP